MVLDVFEETLDELLLDDAVQNPTGNVHAAEFESDTPNCQTAEETSDTSAPPCQFVRSRNQKVLTEQLQRKRSKSSCVYSEESSQYHVERVVRISPLKKKKRVICEWEVNEVIDDTFVKIKDVHIQIEKFLKCLLDNLRATDDNTLNKRYDSVQQLLVKISKCLLHLENI